jgi:hypothetical protein
MEHRSQSNQRRGGKLRFSAAHLLVALAAMFVVLPFVDELPIGNLVESIIFSAVMLAGIYALGGTQRTLLAALLLAIPTLGARWVNHFWPGTVPGQFGLVVAMLFVAIVIAHLLYFIAKSDVVDAEVLCSAIAVYLLIALLWAFGYTLLANLSPRAFTYSDPLSPDTKMSGFTALYFSLQVLTTITYGDVTPATNVARMLTLVEAACGVLYMAILIARLVGIYSSGSSAGDR